MVIKFWLSYCLHVQDSCEAGRCEVCNSSNQSEWLLYFENKEASLLSGVDIVLITDRMNATHFSLNGNVPLVCVKGLFLVSRDTRKASFHMQ
jgi:hypothetical protein